jgi:AraC-like DNA-binding protein
MAHKVVKNIKQSLPNIVFAGGYAGSGSFPIHRHDKAWELIYLRDGCIEQLAGNETLSLGPGMFVVHPPGTSHGDLAQSDYFLFHVLLTSDHPLSWPKFGRDLEGSPICALLGILVQDWHNGWVHREALLRHSAVLLDILMKRCVLQTEEVSKALSVVARAQRILRRDFREAINIGEVASQLDISRSTLYAYFHQVLGQTPHELLDEIRQQHAVFLLRHSQLSVGEVARGSGFYSASHLGRKLRKTYQLTAREIRESPLKS